MSQKTQRFCILSSEDLFAAPLARGADGTVTLTLPVLPQGEFDHPTYGRLSWTPQKFEQMEENFVAGVTGYAPMLNADHASGNPFAAAAPAYGWPKRLYHEDGKGLFCEVELTDLGVEAIENKRYRYTSAEIADRYVTSEGKVYANVFCGLALTNKPFHDTMPAIFTSGEQTRFCIASAPTQLAPPPGPELIAEFTAQLQRRGTRAGVKGFALADGQLSFSDIHQAVYAALLAETGGEEETDWDEWPHIEDLYPGFVIYRRGYGPPWLKRGYTMQGRETVLAPETAEVEWIWVEKARQAFAAAQRVVRRERQAGGTPPTTAGQPAKGESMQAQPKSFGQRLWEMLGFGDKESATREEFALALDAAPAPAAEPVADPGRTTTRKEQFGDPQIAELLHRVTAQEQELARLRREREEADRALLRQRAQELINRFVSEGKITPAQRDLTDEKGEPVLLQVALRDPVAFEKLYSAAQPQVDLSQRGGLRPTGASGEGNGGDTYDAKVAALCRGGMDLVRAAEQVAREHPELYNARMKGGR